MAFNPMDFFQAGNELGKAKKSPFAYGVQNVSDIFDKMTEAQLTQTPLQQAQTDYYRSRANGQTQGTGVYSFNPLTAVLEEVATVPKGSVVRNTLGADDLKQKALIQQEAQVTGKTMESGSKLGTAVKRLNLINNQLNKALPTGNNNPLTQRIMGPLAVAGAKTGIVPNAKLMALKKNIRPIGIQLIRAFGEVGNLSEPEQASSMDVVSNEKLTEDERLESIKQFAEFAIAGARPEAVDMMMKDPGVASIVKDLGINVGQDFGGGGDEDAMVAEALAKYPQNKKAILAMYKERNKGKDYGK